MENKEIDHAARAHAIIAPSSVGRTIKCPGWIAFNKLHGKGEPETSVFAIEGTIAHEIAEYRAMHYGADEKTLPAEFVTKGDADMHFHGTGYGKFLNMLERKFSAGQSNTKMSVAYERRLKFSDNIWGTLDYVMVGKRNGKWCAIIVDYKYGQGVAVSAAGDDNEGNPQLKTYAACLAEESRLQGIELDQFHFFIYQPRTPGEAHSVWKCDADVMNEWADKLRALEIQVESDTSLDAEGLSHCQFCPNQPICPAFMDEISKGALAVLQDSPEFESPDIDKLSMEELLEVFTKKKPIEHFLKGVEAHLMRLLESGEEIPGYKLVEGRSSRKWVEDIHKVARGLRKLGVEEPYKPKSLITIGAVEKVTGKGKEAKEAIATFVTYTEPAKQMVKLSDKRKAIDVSADLAETLTTLD